MYALFGVKKKRANLISRNVRCWCSVSPAGWLPVDDKGPLFPLKQPDAWASPEKPEAQEASSEPQSPSMGAILTRQDSHLRTWGGSPQKGSG